MRLLASTHCYRESTHPAEWWPDGDKNAHVCVCVFLCACRPQVGLCKCLFEGVTAFKKEFKWETELMMVLYCTAQLWGVLRVRLCVLACCPGVCDSVGLMSGAAQVGSREKGWKGLQNKHTWSHWTWNKMHDCFHFHSKRLNCLFQSGRLKCC